MLANQALTDVRQRLTQETKGRRGRSADPVWANRRLLLKAEDKLSDRARNRLETVFAVDDPTGKLEAAWRVKEQVRAICRWSKEIEVLIVTGATTAKVEANNTTIKSIKRTGRGYRNTENYKSRILLTSATRTAA